MSVQIADFKIYRGVASKMFDASFRTTCDINHFSCCFSFKEPLTEEKIWDIVSTWLDLNEISYVGKYAANHDDVKYETLSKQLVKRLTDCPNTFQFLKWLQCIRYNIEVCTIEELRDLNEWEQYCMNFLTKLIQEAQSAIIDSLPEYQAATWSE